MKRYTENIIKSKKNSKNVQVTQRKSIKKKQKNDKQKEQTENK